MPKQQKAKAKSTVRVPNTIAYMLAIIGLLILLSGTLALQLHDQSAQASRKTVSVSLGAMQYRFANGGAVKRTDTTVTSLKSFLTAAGQKDIDLGCTSAYYNVV